MRRFALCCSLFAATALAHDLSVDVAATGTAPSEDNPRTGSLGMSAAGSYDLNDAWSLTGMAVYTRDFATRTSDSYSPGSNVFLFSAGVMWLPTDSLMTMLTLSLSPPVEQSNATTVTGPLGRETGVVINSRTSSFGAMWNGLWSSAGLSNLEHTLDVSLGFNRYSVIQRLFVPNSIASNTLRDACEANPMIALCPLFRGIATPLWQGRFGAGYTATIALRTEVGLDGTLFLYDQPPADVGYFSLVSFGRDLGMGVPVLPLQLSLRPHVSHRFGPVLVKLTYHYGLYTEGLGALHALTARVSWKINQRWKLSLSVTGQTDVADGVAGNRGGQALLGALYMW